MKLKKLAIPMLLGTILIGCSAEGTEPDKEQKEIQQDIVEKDNQEQNVGGDKTQQDKQENSKEVLLEKKYFNEVIEVDGKEIIKNVDNILVFVNKESALLPEDYEPSDLVIPDVRFSFTVTPDIEKAYMRKEAAEALEEMFTQAESEGIYLFAVSGYRSYDRQKQIFQNKVNQVGDEEQAAQVVAVPGTSEHQTGLTMDISSESAGFELVEQFADTPEGQWLADNAHKFGFILRYPKGKEHITGYTFEPWHFRYVGKEAAEIIYENDWTLEEFFEAATEV